MHKVKELVIYAGIDIFLLENNLLWEAEEGG